MRILGCLARGCALIRTILSRDVTLGHGVLLHLLQDNILQRGKFRPRDKHEVMNSRDGVLERQAAGIMAVL